MEDNEEREIYQLSDLEVEAIGLVRRGANRKPFFFVKSESGGTEMTDETKEPKVEQPVTPVTEPAPVPESTPAVEPASTPEPESFAALSPEDKKAVRAMLSAVGKDKLGDRTWAMLSALAGSGPPEKSSEKADEFSEKLREQEERFAEQLATERKAREAMAEKFAEERRKRRLREFTDVAEAEFTSLATGEEFAADLMAFHDADEKRYERLVSVLKAAEEAVSKGALFEQFSSAHPGESGDPFEAKVEVIRKEKFGEMEYNTGWAKAFDVAMTEAPDLARAYSKTH